MRLPIPDLAKDAVQLHEGGGLSGRLSPLLVRCHLAAQGIRYGPQLAFFSPALGVRLDLCRPDAGLLRRSSAGKNGMASFDGALTEVLTSSCEI